MAMRKPPIDFRCPSVPPQRQPPADPTVYRIQVITPLFGGGVEPGVNDPVTIIRPSSVRGHLRFWWRATRGARFSDVRELRQRESEIWGSSSNASLVQIRTVPREQDGQVQPQAVARYQREIDRNGNEQDKLRWNDPFNSAAFRYILFPFQGKPPVNGENAPKKCWSDVGFALSIYLPEVSTTARRRAGYNEQRQELELPLLGENADDISLDVDAAVWAWVNFGGIGARTRRGCGALCCEALAAPAFDGYGDWIKSKFTKYQLLNPPPKRAWPVLSPSRVLCNSAGTSRIAAWTTAVGTLHEFRQGVPVGRAAGTPGRPAGRSHWPEPETIRKLILQQRSASRPRKLWHTEQPLVPMGFPRAEFGLPIIFEIPGDPVYAITNDPSDKPTWNDKKNIKPTLQAGKDSDRLASPLIVRPLMFQDGKAHAMIVCLKVRRRRVAYLAPGTHDLLEPYLVGKLEIVDRRFSTYSESPLKGHSRLGSALTAFLSFARNKGFV